ncbi:MAG: hypothetical protein HY525_10715 [Betaproteobacteria bacterium]|nr:hypothetical protein [Betaproteobacteria bacterium]
MSERSSTAPFSYCASSCNSLCNRACGSRSPLRSNCSIAKRFQSAIANRSSFPEKNFPHLAHPTSVNS